MTRILIADDHEVVRDGVRGFLERHTNYVVVAEAADGEEAIAKAIETEPDVALLDYSLPIAKRVRGDAPNSCAAIENRSPYLYGE